MPPNSTVVVDLTLVSWKKVGGQGPLMSRPRRAAAAVAAAASKQASKLSNAQCYVHGSDTCCCSNISAWCFGSQVEDVTADGGVVKKCLVESTEWKQPNQGAKVGGCNGTYSRRMSQGLGRHMHTCLHTCISLLPPLLQSAEHGRWGLKTTATLLFADHPAWCGPPG